MKKKRFQRPIQRRKKRTQKDNTSTAYNSGRGYGGFVNPISGAGTTLDKNSLSFFSPTRIVSKNFNETLYVESWAAAKFINIPVDDMFFKWRTFCDMENETIKLVEKVETQFKIKSKLSKTIKSSRLHGTGLFVILTKDSTPEKPLNIQRMMPGDLANIITVDRFDANIVAKENNPFSTNFGKPLFYSINLKHGGSLVAHHSRVVRFDSIVPLSDNSWQSYDQDWGVASLIPVITEIFQDSNVSKGVAHLVNEASIAIQKVEGFEDAISGTGDGDMTLQERMEQVNLYRSIYRTTFMDSEDDFQRVAVSFAGLPDVLDRNAIRLAAAADIPETRFWSKTLSGLQSTGDGEARNYALKVGSDQNNQLPEPLETIDSVIAKHLGLTEKICYIFPSILDLSEKDQTEVALKKSQIVVPLVTAGLIDEDEARAILDGDAIIGNLDEQLEPIEGVDEFKKSLANIQVERGINNNKKQDNSGGR